jgi:hypothetical protein
LPAPFASDARKITRAIQSLRFGKLGRGFFGVAVKRIGSGKVCANEWNFRVSAARSFQPNDCLVDM